MLKDVLNSTRIRLALTALAIAIAPLLTVTECAQAAYADLPVSKSISRDALLKAYKSMTIAVDEDGKKVKYMGVPLRAVFADVVPEYKIDSMPDWKNLARKTLVVEVTGADGYPGLVNRPRTGNQRLGRSFPPRHTPRRQTNRERRATDLQTG